MKYKLFILFVIAIPCIISFSIIQIFTPIATAATPPNCIGVYRGTCMVRNSCISANGNIIDNTNCDNQGLVCCRTKTTCSDYNGICKSSDVCKNEGGESIPNTECEQQYNGYGTCCLTQTCSSLDGVCKDARVCENESGESILHTDCEGQYNGDGVCCKVTKIGATTGIQNPLRNISDINTLIDKIGDFLIILAIAVTPIIIVYAGFLYITATGNEQKIKTANKVLIWTLIGLAVVLIAKGVPVLIKQLLEIEETTYNLSPFIFLAQLAQAQNESISEVNIDIWVILDNVLNWFFGITLAIAVIMLIYAGFTFITSDGNSAKLQTASKILIFALIGVAIALLAKGLPTLIQNFLEGKESSSSSINNNENNIAANDLIEQALEDLPDLGGSCLAGWVHNPDCQELEKCCSWLQGICDSAPQCGGGGGGGGKYVNLI